MPPQAATTLWSEILDRFRVEFPALFRTWLLELDAPSLSGGTLELVTRNEAQAAYLSSSCSTQFSEIAQAITGRFVTVRITRPPRERIARPDAIRRPAPDRNIVNGANTFETLVVGPENRLAVTGAKSLVEQPGSAPNPLLLIGPTGVGKTHLLEAVCRAMHPGASAVDAGYINALDFVTGFMSACEKERGEHFRARFTEADLLALDDVQALAGRERSQEELFQILRSRIDSDRPVVLAIDRPPNTVTGLAERLASRFSAGLVAPLDHPCRESRIRIAQVHAQRLQLDLPEDAAVELADQTADAAAIVDALRQASVECAERGCRLDRELLRRIVGCERPARPGAVIDAVCQILGLADADLRKRRQPGPHRPARQMAMHLVRRLTALDLTETARLFHVTTAELLHQSQQIEAQAASDAKIASLLDEITAAAKNASA